ncbi:MAG: hypothetical protein ACKV2T_33725 [Kofleriaceae bacterium]
MTPRAMLTTMVGLALASGCARSAPRGPIALPDVTNDGSASSNSNIDASSNSNIDASSNSNIDASSNSNIDARSNPNRVVLLSMRDVEPYEYVPPRDPEPPPPIAVGAPVYGMLAGSAMGIVLSTGLTLLTEHRWPDRRKRDRDRLERAVLYGAGLGLVGGTFTLANSIAERMEWREREKQRAAREK